MYADRDTKMGKVIYAIGSHPWEFFICCCLIAGALWWVVMPLSVYRFGRPVRARVMDTWLTPSEVCVWIACWQLAGVRLEVLSPDGQTNQVKKYCREDVVFGGPVFRGAQFNARRLFGRVVLPDAPCDSDQIFFMGMLLFLISLIPVWKRLRSEDTSGPWKEGTGRDLEAP
jgi:hypothetical protein